MLLNITVLPGDGIGPEVTAEAVRVLECVARAFGHELNLKYKPVGGCRRAEQQRSIARRHVASLRELGRGVAGRSREAQHLMRCPRTCGPNQDC